MMWALRLGLAAICLYLIYAAVMIRLHPSFIYPFAADGFSSRIFRETVIPGADETPVFVQIHDAGPQAPVVVYFMGNAGSLAYFGQVLALHAAAGRSVVAMEYRGGGGRPGMPSEPVLKADALAVIDALPKLFPAGHGRVILHGYSMGSGLAMHGAASRKVDAVMLDAPYARMCELMARASWLPACHLPFVQKWDNLALAGQIGVPVLIQVGAGDRLIPPEQARRLADAMASDGMSVGLYIWPGRGHVDLPDEPAWAPTMDDFIASVAR